MDDTRRYRVSGDAPFTLFHKLRLPGEVVNLTEREAQQWLEARPGSLEALDEPPAEESPRRRTSSRRKRSASSKE
jgi:hypothetical protein